MSESIQRASGNKARNLTQRTNAHKAEQIADSNDLAGSLTQEVLSTKKSDIESVLSELLSAIDQLGLKNDEKDDVKAQAQTAEAQMKARKPNPTIVTESLKTIWQTLKGAAAAAAASGAGQLVKSLMDKITGLFT